MHIQINISQEHPCACVQIYMDLHAHAYITLNMHANLFISVCMCSVTSVRNPCSIWVERLGSCQMRADNEACSFGSQVYVLDIV